MKDTINMRVYSAEIKNQVRELRVLGKSLNEIQYQTNVPRTTIRDWISDIILSDKQKEVLKNRVMKVLQEGRIEAQKIRKEKRTKQVNDLFTRGVKAIGSLNARDIFIAGIALYWAEGFKNRHEHRLGFCNSDPAMIIFYLKWLKKSLNVDNKDLIARVTINKSYEEKTREIELYWSKKTGIPLEQFTKPFYQNTVWKKQYSDNNYYGVLRVHVKNSLFSLLEMKGWIEGLKLNVLK